MLNTWIDQWLALPLALGFAVAWLVQVAMYVGAAGEISIVYGFLRRHLGIGGLIDSRPLPPGQLRQEIIRSLLVCPIFAAPTLLFLHYPLATLWPGSWQQALWQIGGFLLLNDFCAYWTHRLLHVRGISKYHGAHHRSKRVTPWSALSMHPVEAALSQLPYLIFFGAVWSAGLPMGIGTLLALQLLLMVGQANSHSNYDPFAHRDPFPGKFSRWLKSQTLFHQLHHRHGRENYGYMGPHWDYVFGTARI